MASKNGTKPKAPTIEVNGEIFEARDMTKVSIEDEITADALQMKLAESQDTTREYADLMFDIDLDSDDEDEDFMEPTPEMVRQRKALYIGILRFCYPKITKPALRALTEADIREHASAAATYMAQSRQEAQPNKPDPIKRGRGKSKVSANISSG